ncbi:hypothetical protein QA639_34255 [Bradyrhizobium pachyrhizi]|uniref:hypothetical protein n=1 Tax=Bradyrhizobium pachyrhizi TaxID=280333 RepID=UPI0024B27115|nr:hypothetical protein [Bradyrhizobium pachyrhizi]WFU54615.1 hypothetical protein QA639_34255 [Bradyrhizobium pachyrhizi]
MDPSSVRFAAATASPRTSRAKPEQLKVNQAAFEAHLSEAAQGLPRQADIELSRHSVFAGHEAGSGMVAQQPDMQLILVSNRVSSFDAGKPKTGGLAAALEPAVERSGAVWMGASGTLSDGSEQLTPLEQHGKGQVAKVDLPAAHYAGFYHEFQILFCGRRFIR